MRHIPAVYLRYASGGTPVALTAGSRTAPPRAARHHGVTCPGTRMEIRKRPDNPCEAARRPAVTGRRRRRGHGTCPAAGRRAATRFGLRPAARPASPGTRQFHRRYDGESTSVRPGGTAPPRGSGAGRAKAGGWYTEGPSQVHGRTIAGQWHRAASEREDPRPRGAHRAPVRRPFPPRRRGRRQGTRTRQAVYWPGPLEAVAGAFRLLVTAPQPLALRRRPAGPGPAGPAGAAG